MTRQQYLASEDQAAAHREYYSQFVNEGVRLAVNHKFGQRIHQSKDPHFNDIPLHMWDSLGLSYLSYFAAKNRTINGENAASKSDVVCMLKEAAQQIRENGE